MLVMEADGPEWAEGSGQNRLGPAHEGPHMLWWVYGFHLECSGNPLVSLKVLNRGMTGSDLTVFEVTLATGHRTGWRKTKSEPQRQQG